jgi:hypothetical protein
MRSIQLRWAYQVSTMSCRLNSRASFQLDGVTEDVKVGSRLGYGSGRSSRLRVLHYSAAAATCDTRPDAICTLELNRKNSRCTTARCPESKPSPGLYWFGK